MADVVRFVSAGERELRAIALELIEDLGRDAGYQIGLLARWPGLTAETRKRLLAVADTIEREQGFGSYFAGDTEAPRGFQ